MRRKGMSVVSTHFENLRPLGLWVNELAGGPYKYQKGTCLFNLTLEKVFPKPEGVAKINESKEKEKHEQEKTKQDRDIVGFIFFLNSSETEREREREIR